MVLRDAATATLPAGLRSWSAALGALEPAVVHALGPLLQRIDELVARHADVEGPDGEPEGYGGLTTRGRFERLLASEWALAEAEPDEFLRRAATRELLHVETAFRHVPPAGVTRVVVDTGPSQAGAARLVQLAALVVLHRRAAAHGAPLEIGVLGARADRWLRGDLPELLAAWLAARQASDAGPQAVVARHDADPAAWFVVRAGVLADVPAASRPPRRVLALHDESWSDAGVVGVDAVLAGERVHLPVPAAPEALRLLRGQGFRRVAAPRTRTSRVHGEHVLRDAVLTSAAPVLLGRGRDASELVSARVTPGAAKARPQARRLPGPVIAAGATGRRILALHAAAGGAMVTVLGKHLVGWDGTLVDGAAARLADVDLAATSTLSPVHHHRGDLWVGWASGWRLLARDGITVAPHVVAVLPTAGDHTLVAMRDADGRVGGEAWGRVEVPPGARFVAGGGWLGVETGPGDWLLVGQGRRDAVRTRTESRVVGLVVLDGVPALVTSSATDVVVRLASPRGERTLTALSGEQQKVAVHPVQPWLARDVGAGEIEVHDLQRGVRLATFPGNLA